MKLAKGMPITPISLNNQSHTQCTAVVMRVAIMGTKATLQQVRNRFKRSANPSSKQAGKNHLIYYAAILDADSSYPIAMSIGSAKQSTTNSGKNKAIMITTPLFRYRPHKSNYYIPKA